MQLLDRPILSLSFSLFGSTNSKVNCKKSTTRVTLAAGTTGLLPDLSFSSFVVSPPDSDADGLFKRISQTPDASFYSAAQALLSFECLFVSFSVCRRVYDSTHCREFSRERRVDDDDAHRGLADKSGSAIGDTAV